MPALISTLLSFEYGVCLFEYSWGKLFHTNAYNDLKNILTEVSGEVCNVKQNYNSFHFEYLPDLNVWPACPYILPCCFPAFLAEEFSHITDHFSLWL